MFITNSLPELWLYYAILSLVLLGAGYFAVSFLPRTLRWLLVGLIAGAIWVPWFFTSPASTDVAAYSGIAPAIIIAALGLLGKQFSASLIVVAIGAVAGAIIALRLVRRYNAAHSARTKRTNSNSSGKGRGKGRTKATREEPSV